MSGLAGIQVPYGLEELTRSGGPLQHQRMTVIGVQCALRKRGVAVAQDGYWGPQTALALGMALLAFQRTPVEAAEYADFDRDTGRNSKYVTVTANFRTWLYGPADAAGCARLAVPETRVAPATTPEREASVARPPEAPPAALTAPASKLPWGWIAVGGALALLLGGVLIGYSRKVK